MRFLPLLALLISPFVSALTLDSLQQRFTEQPVVRAHFDQTRTIKDLPQPLRSQGNMLIARDQDCCGIKRPRSRCSCCSMTNGWCR